MRLLLFFVFLLYFTNVQCQFTSVQAGNWEDCNTWGTCPGTVAGVDYPGRTDDVVLNHRVLISSTNDNGSAAENPNNLGLTNVCGGCGGCNLPAGCNNGQFYQNGKVIINSGGELESSVRTMFNDTIQVNSGGILDINNDVFIIGFINAASGAAMEFGDDVIISGGGVLNSDQDYVITDDIYIDGDDAYICGSGTVTLNNSGGGSASEIQTFNINDDTALDQICSNTTIVCADGDCCDGGNCTSDIASSGGDGEISSGEGGGDAPTILPVTLLNFQLTQTPEGNLLKWSTVAELDNDFFSIHTYTTLDNKRLVAKINGAGTSQEQNVYSYLDKISSKGVYYELSQTDFDGSHEVLGVVFSGKQNDQIASVSLLQNPISSLLSLKFNGSTGFVDIVIRDLSGKVVFNHYMHAVGEPQVNIGSVKSGAYLLSVNNSYISFSERLLVNQ